MEKTSKFFFDTRRHNMPELLPEEWVEILCRSRHAVGLVMQTCRQLRDAVKLLETSDNLLRKFAGCWSEQFWLNHKATWQTGLCMRTVPKGPCSAWSHA